jgi:hypothetical protein
MRSLPLILLSAFLSLGTPACATHQVSSDSAPASQARVEVVNNSTIDMDLYVRTGKDRPIRLGLAPASDTTSFALAPALLVGSGLIRFEARPLRARGEPVLSEPFAVGPGDELHWSIPPQ